MILYEEERFYILDTGSSNGTFVNNIRLSRTGEESKMTEIFTSDIIRFGSDIVDKVGIEKNLQVNLEQKTSFSESSSNAKMYRDQDQIVRSRWKFDVYSTSRKSTFQAYRLV